MSVNPQVMQQLLGRMGQGQGMGAAGGGASPSPNPQGGTPPAAAPISAPQKKEGLKTAAMTNLDIARNMVEQALTAFDHTDPEYKISVDILKLLTKAGAKHDTSDLVPAEVMQMVRGLPQMGGGSDVQKMIMQMMQQQQKQPQPQQAAA